jgi:autotransporter-associated beta strand protein
MLGLNGSNGVGTLNISSGATIHATRNVEVGWNSGTGVLTASGAGTALKADGSITIGHAIPGNGTTTGTLTISDGAAVQAGLVLVGFDQGAVATLNIGAGGAAGTINAPIQMGGDSSTINFNHNEANYVFSNVISNYQSGPSASGSVNFLGSGTTTLTAVNTYTSATNVNAGRLVIASGGSIANSVLTTVNNGATLSGAGSVGNVNVATGGSIVQNGTDRLTVKDITFGAGSTYQVGINANGQSGSIAAANATLNGGTVKVMAGSGSYVPGTSYAILTTTGNITGKFNNSIISDLVFLQAGLSYTANAVNLQLTRNGTSFGSVANTPNQRAVASGLAGLGTGHPVVGALLQQNVAGAQQAFDALSGEAHASSQTALIVNALAVGDTVNSRLLQPYGFSAAPATSQVTGFADDSYASLNYADGKAPVKAPWMARKAPVPVVPPVVYATWAQGIGSWLDRNGNGNAANLTSSSGGVISGIDATWMGLWRFGVAGGYSHSDINVNARASSLDVDSYHVSIYGGARQGRFGLQGGFVYSWNDIASSRQVAFPGFMQTVLADYSAGTTQFFGELNYQYYFTGTAWLETFAGSNYLRHETDAFNETGGAAALAVAHQTQDVTYTTLGLRAAALLGQSGEATFVGRGTLGWRHAFGDVDSAVLASFAGGTPFNVTGVPIAADTVLSEAGIDMNFRQNMTLGLSWSGQFAEGASENRVNGKFVYRW